MTSEPTPARRGRPRKITREAIADAGRRLTLPKVTVADVAQELGVTIRSLYKHTSGIEDIQIITAEAIFASWEAPAPEGQPLEEHLLAIASSLRRLAIENPGIAGFLLRTSSDISPALVAAMDAHQRSVAEAYRLPLVHSSILLATVAEHSLAVTDVVHAGKVDAETCDAWPTIRAFPRCPRLHVSSSTKTPNATSSSGRTHLSRDCSIRSRASPANQTRSKRDQMTTPTRRPKTYDPKNPSATGGRLRGTQLTLAYDRREICRDLNVEIPQGKVTVIIGPNASGKSTVLRALARLINPTDGAVSA